MTYVPISLLSQQRTKILNDQQFEDLVSAHYSLNNRACDFMVVGDRPIRINENVLRLTLKFTY